MWGQKWNASSYNTEDLTQKNYKITHDWAVKVIDWELCKRLKSDNTTKWYMQKPEFIQENKMHEILWHFEIHMDQLIPAKKSNVALLKKNKTFHQVYFAFRRSTK